MIAHHATDPERNPTMIHLTVQEIRDLAKFAGIAMDEEQELDADELATEISVTMTPSECKNDDGKIERYAHLAYLSEYPEEGCYPLGDPLFPLGKAKRYSAAD